MRFPFLAAAALIGACARTAPLPAPPTAAGFEPEIAAYESDVRAHPIAPGGIVFVGSSSIRLWESLAADFSGLPVVNRGFGGSTMTDVAWFTPRIVLPLRPHLVVLYAGDNDLAAGHTPEQVLSDYRAFVGHVHASLPATRVVFVSIKPSPSRWALVERIRRANALIAADIARDPRAAYVDVFTPMLGPDGRPRPELFRDDSLHMTAAGYALWHERLAPLVH